MGRVSQLAKIQKILALDTILLEFTPAYFTTLPTNCE